MRDVGGTAARVGALGVAVPFAAGYGAGLALGESGATSVFLGAALVATSVGITSAVLIELNALATVAARTILGAPVIDDILAMVLLASKRRSRPSTPSSRRSSSSSSASRSSSTPSPTSARTRCCSR